MLGNVHYWELEIFHIVFYMFIWQPIKQNFKTIILVDTLLPVNIAAYVIIKALLKFHADE